MTTLQRLQKLAGSEVQVICNHTNLVKETVIQDYYDPQQYDGHGQAEVTVTVCKNCGEVVDEN